MANRPRYIVSMVTTGVNQGPKLSREELLKMWEKDIKKIKAMNPNELESKIISMVMDIVNGSIDSYGINEESSLRDDFGMDSLDLVEFAIKLEKEFSISINDLEFEKCETIGDVLHHVDSLIN